MAAPVLMVLLRIVQGLSVGGELTTSLIYLAEQAAPGRRAFTAIWTFWGAWTGILPGSGVGAIVTNLLDPQQVVTWSWRVPFLLGSLVVVTGVLMRRSIHVDRVADCSTQPLRDTFGVHCWANLQVALLTIGYGVAFYTAFIYAVTFIKELDHLQAGIAFNLNTEALLLLLVITPLIAWLSDRMGRRPLLIGGFVLLTFGAWPMFWLIHHSHATLAVDAPIHEPHRTLPSRLSPEADWP